MNKNTLRIGAYDYDLVYDDAPMIGGELMNGVHDREGLNIEIRVGMPIAREWQTVWHEVMHAIFDNAAFEIDNEEQVIEIVSNGIVQVLRDNPRLADWSKK